MAQNSENRRIRMTKQLMKDALLELLEKKELISISVTAVCETADVHRSTFYNYYSNTSELLREIEQDFLDQMPTPVQIRNDMEHGEVLETVTAVLDYVKANEKTFRILFGEMVNTRFHARIMEILCTEHDASKEQPGRSTDYSCLYAAGGIIALLREWIRTDFSISSRHLAEMMSSLSKKVIS